MGRRKICVITGTRADYGILFQLIKKLKKERSINLQLIAAGMHLSHEFGLTFKEILNDGFKIDKKVEMILSGDTPTDISKSVGMGFFGFADAFKDLKPDLIVVLGDRYELLAAAYTANIYGIPVCHIHGGECSEGVIDECTRHSITKMSQIHMVANKVYFKRVHQLGEQKNKIYLVGGMGVDNIKNSILVKKTQLEKDLKFKFKKKNLLVTYHPVTLEKDTAGEQFQNLLDVLSEFKDINVIFTKPNSDTYGRKIIKMIDDFVKKFKNRSCSFTSLGHKKYLSVMKNVDGVLGNSSSGLLEAPSFKIGTINIGDRQKKRLRALSVLDCKPSIKDIRKSINILYSKKFNKKLKLTKNPYGNGGASTKIVKILKKIDIKNLIKKEFYDY